MSKFDDFFQTVLDGVKDAGGEAAKDFLKQATVDSQQFKAQAEADLQRWTTERANGEIDDDEFQSLVRGQLAEATLAALLKAGVAQQKAAELTDKVIDLAISTAFKFI
ncbi:MAG TPA: hypothetical protein VG475_04795 [Pseudolabrys sp.]|jgi:hypothetical protein|nr:hypothetical protein [Pseudolabrys sp.]